jgi:hypothetical protein
MRRLTLTALITLALGTSMFATQATAKTLPTTKQQKATNAIVTTLNRHLAGSPMAGLGRTLERQGRLHGISPYFIVAVAHKESSEGRAACSANPKNVWGLGACGRAWSPPYFRTWPQAVNYFVRFVKGRWPSATSPYHFYGYCRGCEGSWASRVSARMISLGGTTSVRYKP